MTLTSIDIPNPLESLEQKAAGSSLGVKLAAVLQKYTLVLAIGLLISVLLLIGTWVGVLSQPPNYKLGDTVFEVISPIPFSQVSGGVNIHLNLVTSEQVKDLRAFVKSGDSSPVELSLAEVGKNIISLTGVWMSEGAKAPGFIEVTIYDVVSPDHPVIVNYTRVPVTIAN